MQRVVLALFAMLGCGRIGFDARSDGGDDTGDGSGGARISLELPTGGQFTQVEVAPDGTWYALSRTTGVFRSDDAGTTWTRCGAGLARNIAVAADNSVWASGSQAVRSTDRCATWADTNAPRYTEAFGITPSGIYALMNGAIARWNGSAWVTLTTPLDGSYFWSMSYLRSTGTLLVGTTNGLLRSIDSTTFNTITMGLPDPNVKDVAGGSTLAYAVTLNGTGSIGCGTADGNTWTPCNTRGGYSVAIDPADDQRVVAAVYDDLFVTTDAFAAVQRGMRMLSGMDDATVLDLFPSAGGAFIAASDRGVFAAPPSTGAITFSPRNTGLYAWDIDYMLRDGDDVYLTTRGGVLHSTIGSPFTISTQGMLWNTETRGIAVLPDGRVMVAGRDITVTADRGATWTIVYPLGPPDGYRAHAVEIVGTRAIVGTSARLLLADPPYTSWAPTLVGGAPRQINAIKQVGTLLVVGSPEGLFTSPDGTTFTLRLTRGVRTLYVLTDGQLAVGLDDGVVIGDGTALQNAGLTGRVVNAFLEVEGKLIAVTDNGVAYTTDRSTWLPVPGAETLPASAVLYDGTLVIGSNSNLVRVALP